MRALIAAALITTTLISGCAAAPSCTVGVMIFGPFPAPYFSCDLTLEPSEDEEEDE